MKSSVQSSNLTKLIRGKEEGFSLIELVVVVSVLSVLSAIAIPTFNCFQRKSQATAALAAMKQIQSECEIDKADTSILLGTFTPSNLNSYQIQSDGSNGCSGASSTGLISAIPSDTNSLPTFILASNSNELTYSFKGQTGTDLSNSLKLVCSISNGPNGDDGLKDELEKKAGVIKDTYVERGCSAYVWVDGPKWDDAQAIALSLGGNLATINDEEENEWVVNQFTQKVLDDVSDDGQGVKNLFIGLTRNNVQKDAGSNDGWISGESSSYRPNYWGATGLGNDWDGNYTALAIRDHESYTELAWNDFPDWQHAGVGLVEIPICD